MHRLLPRILTAALTVAAVIPVGRGLPATAGPIDERTGIAAPRVVPFSVSARSVTPTLVRNARPVRVAYEIRGMDDTTLISLAVSNVLGRTVRTISVRPERSTGVLIWDGTDDDGREVEQGLYSLELDGTRSSTGTTARSRTAPERISAPAGVVRMERRVDARVVSRVADGGRQVALTFDDCNFRPDWSAILDILARRHVHATFFCLGLNVERFPLLAQRTVAEGHSIGSHTFSHPDLRFQSASSIAGQLLHTSNVWWNVAKVTPVPFLRPPYGAYDSLAQRVAGNLGYRNVVMWDVDPSDWSSPGAGVIVTRVLLRVRPGSIVVLHAVPETVAALPRILRGLEHRGLQPVSLDVLLAGGRVVT